MGRTHSQHNHVAERDPLARQIRGNAGGPLLRQLLVELRAAPRIAVALHVYTNVRMPLERGYRRVKDTFLRVTQVPTLASKKYST